ncbi:hypothetical protein [Actinomadura sp. 6N118]|uniref:hypothetical protein n=1 Tax=Actinomadura sp. 6N118 TaxID=3375151 RepID=UPI00378DE039
MSAAPNLRLIRTEERPQSETGPELRTRVPPSPLLATLAAVDICSFGKGDDYIQLHQRREMYEHMAEAFEITQIPWQECYLEDRGDGALIVAPSNVPAEYLLDPLAHHLTAVLRRYNRLASAAARLQLRLAVNFGYVYRDDHGFAGRPLIHLFRLLEAAEFKQSIADADADADFGLIVAERLYTDAVNYGGFVNPGSYQTLRINCKETRALARVWLSPGKFTPQPCSE